MWVMVPELTIKPRLSDFAIRKHFHETLIYFVPAFATSLYTVLDKTLIGTITGDAFQNGYYEQADKIVRMAMTLTFTAVNLVMGARMSYLFGKGNVSEAKQRTMSTLGFVLFLGYAFAFGIASIAQSFVPLFFGLGYEPVIGLLWLMCPLIIIIGISNCLGSLYYTPSGKRAQSARYIIAGAIANLVLSLLLIPKMGMYGAVIGSTTAEVLITCLYVRNCSFISWSEIWQLSFSRLIVATFAFIISMLIGKIGTTSLFLTLVLQIISFAAIYNLSLFFASDNTVKRLIDMMISSLQSLISGQ